jgi:hypothetical protein
MRQPIYKIDIPGNYREYSDYQEALAAATHLINMKRSVRELGFSRPEQLIKGI